MIDLDPDLAAVLAEIGEEDALRIAISAYAVLTREQVEEAMQMVAKSGLSESEVARITCAVWVEWAAARGCGGQS